MPTIQQVDPLDALQELYYRHLHSLAMRHDGLITFEHRKSMWDNYAALFKVLASIEASMNLPNSWLWDMIDEFMYQFQTYRALAGQANRQPDIAFLKANPDVWSIDKVRSPPAALHAGTCVLAVLPPRSTSPGASGMPQMRAA